MNGLQRGAVVGILAVAIVALLHAVPVSDLSSLDRTVVNCTASDVPCRSTSIETTVTNCTPWFTGQPRDQRSCDRTTANLSRVSLITDPANHVQSNVTSTRPTATLHRLPVSGLWDMEFLPDGRMLLTTAAGEVVRYEAGSVDTVGTLDVHTRETTGLLGLAVHPDFPDPSAVYLYYTTGSGGPDVTVRRGHPRSYYATNRISRFTLVNGTLTDERVLLDDIPGTIFHSGGRLEFGPDGKLYATVGDGGQLNRTQRPEYLAGKILRINPDGTVPADNPFGNAVYSMGHRNPQGIAWRPGTGTMYAAEHGPWRKDELNRVSAGENYGWPTRRCHSYGPMQKQCIDAITSNRTPDARCAGFVSYLDKHDLTVAELEARMEPPQWCSRGWTLAPSGMTFVDEPGHPWHGDLFVAGLRGKHLHRYVVDDGTVVDDEIFWYMNRSADEVRFGRRLRDVEFRDGTLWVVSDWTGLASLRPS